MTDESMPEGIDAIAAAEKRGYAKGYQARARRIKRENEAESRRKEQQAFLDRAFLAILPAAMNAVGWTMGDKPIRTTEERVDLAARWAERALKRRPVA